MCENLSLFFFFFFNDTATTEIYTLSLHDALPIFIDQRRRSLAQNQKYRHDKNAQRGPARSEEHTSELQSQSNLVCRLLLEKKKKKNIYIRYLYTGATNIEQPTLPNRQYRLRLRSE